MCSGLTVAVAASWKLRKFSACKSIAIEIYCPLGKYTTHTHKYSEKLRHSDSRHSAAHLPRLRHQSWLSIRSIIRLVRPAAI